MAKVTGSYLIAKTLKEEGVEKLFYLMGGPDFDIVMGCQDFGIETIDFRHEQAAAFAAPRIFSRYRQARRLHGGVRSRHAQPAHRRVCRVHRLLA